MLSGGACDKRVLRDYARYTNGYKGIVCTAVRGKKGFGSRMRLSVRPALRSARRSTWTAPAGSSGMATRADAGSYSLITVSVI